MLTSFSDWKSIGFIIYLIVINLLGMIFSIFLRSLKLIKSDSFPKTIVLIFPILLICFLSLITFIMSVIYYKIEKYKGVWDYLYMIDVSCFKLIEFLLLTLFGIFTNDDLLDSSLSLILERAIWIFIENMVDNFEVNIKKLILILAYL